MQKRIQKLESEINKVNKSLNKNYSWRLYLGLLAFLSLATSVFFNWAWVSVSIFAFIITFYFLMVSATDRFRGYLKKLETYKSFLDRQHKRQQGIYSDPSFIPTPRPRSDLDTDFDLYGSHSVFSQISECFSDIGTDYMVSKFEKAETNVEELLETQKTIKNLAQHPWPIIKTVILGKLEGTHLKVKPLRNLFETPFVNEKQKKWILTSISLWVLGVVGLMAIPLGLNENIPFFLFLGFWFCSLYILGELKSLFFRGIEIEVQLSTLFKVLEQIELTIPTNSEFLKICPHIYKNKPSKELKRLKLNLGFLSIQANPLLALLFNLSMPWNLFFSLRLEAERKKIATHLPLYSKDLEKFEFFSSLSLLYKFQTQCLPDFTGKPFLDVKNVFHPLIPSERVIKNSFHFSPDETCGLITGSNMSGKSTFLRAIGINQILATMGAPVFADEFTTFPAQVQSCIRVQDSVDDGYSYFYAEVKRLRKILDQLNNPTFFIIDEIFKGTNNKERVLGGRAILNSLLTEQSLGFVTTHDMELAQNPPSGVSNWHFSDTFDGSKIIFSYKIKSGPSSTTNALKIMELEGLIKDQRPHLRPI